MSDEKMIGFAVPFFLMHLFPLWLSVANQVRLFLVFNNTYYSISNKRVLMRSGFFGTDFRSIDHDKVSDTSVNVGIIDNMFGTGSIFINTGRSDSNGRISYEKIQSVQNPYEAFKLLKTVSVDTKTDWNYPNANRPAENPGYNTKYDPKK
jgi:uncharacterized membrane protein YdbT with pleckstrin-like domain